MYTREGAWPLETSPPPTQRRAGHLVWQRPIREKNLATKAQRWPLSLCAQGICSLTTAEITCDPRRFQLVSNVNGFLSSVLWMSI